MTDILELVPIDEATRAAYEAADKWVVETFPNGDGEHHPHFPMIHHAVSAYIKMRKAPIGYKLVPIEPTPEMMVAGDTYARQNSPKAGIWWLRRVFEAMISAAPEASE